MNVFADSCWWQINLLLVVLYLMQAPTILAVWYVGGFFLFWIGIMGLANGGGIFIGFLWVIDLGLGLLSLLIVLNLTVFLHDRTGVAIIRREYFVLFALLVLGVLWLPSTSWLGVGEVQLASFELWVVTWVDFFELLQAIDISDLTLLRNIFFVNDVLPFILINFLILYGLLMSLVFLFVSKQWNDTRSLLEQTRENGSQVAGSLFIRQQDFVIQQRATTSVRTWNRDNQRTGTK